MEELYANDADSTLAGAISDVSLSAILSPGTGARFPSPGPDQFFRLTFRDALTTLNSEIVFVTARAGDVLTIQRGQEGTTPQSWLANDLASNLWTAGAAKAIETSANAPDQGIYAVQGLIGFNNAVTPNTQYDFSADVAILRNPTTGALRRVSPVPTMTNDIAAAGPTPNGRDQAGFFSPNVWVYFYLVSNGTTLATVSSLSPPLTGPTLPFGYTEWAFLSAIRLSTVLAQTRVSGNRVFYSAAPAIVTGTATVSTPVSLAAAIPPMAKSYSPIIANLAVTSTPGGVYSLTGLIGSYESGFSGTAGASAVFSGSGGSCELPNISQTVEYRINLQTGSGPTITINVLNYTL